MRWQGHGNTWDLSTWAADNNSLPKFNPLRKAQVAWTHDGVNIAARLWPQSWLLTRHLRVQTGINYLCQVPCRTSFLVFFLHDRYPAPLLQTRTDWELRQILSSLGLSLLHFPPPHELSLMVKKLVLGDGSSRTYCITFFCSCVASSYLLKSGITVRILSPLILVQLKWNKALYYYQISHRAHLECT